MERKKKAGLFFGLFFSILMFTGCSKEEVYVPVTTNTVEVTESGRVVGYMVESFDKEYYDIKELEAMVRTEIEEYNAEKNMLAGNSGTPIIVDKVMMAEDGSANVVVALSFLNGAIYTDYMGKELFYGTVQEAVAAGYALDKKLAEVKNGEVFTGQKLEKNGEKKILILEDTVNVRTNGKVQYLSTNAQLTKDGFVDCTVNEELKYIIIK